MSENTTMTPSAEAFTEVVLEIFRFNGQMLASGDALARPFGLSSALWQVMGAIGDTPLTLAQIARDMGLARQSVRRSARVLEQKGLVVFLKNPAHKRAHLTTLTEEGRAVLEQIAGAYATWANRVAKGLSPGSLQEVKKRLEDLGNRVLTLETEAS